MHDAGRMQVGQLNAGQRAAYETMMESVANYRRWNDRARVFFLARIPVGGFGGEPPNSWGVWGGTPQ